MRHTDDQETLEEWIPGYTKGSWGTVEHICSEDEGDFPSQRKQKPAWTSFMFLVFSIIIFGYAIIHVAEGESESKVINEVWGAPKQYETKEIKWMMDKKEDYYGIYNPIPLTIQDGPLVEVSQRFLGAFKSERFGVHTIGKHISQSIGVQRPAERDQYWDVYQFREFKISEHRGGWVIMIIDAFGRGELVLEKKRERKMGTNLKILHDALKGEFDTELWFVRLDHVGFGDRFWPTSGFPAKCYTVQKIGAEPCMDRLLYAGLKVDEYKTHFWHQYRWLQSFVGKSAEEAKAHYSTSLELKTPVVVILDPEGRAYHVNRHSEFRPDYTLLAYQHQKSLRGEGVALDVNKVIGVGSNVWPKGFQPVPMEKAYQDLSIAANALRTQIDGALTGSDGSERFNAKINQKLGPNGYNSKDRAEYGAYYISDDRDIDLGELQ